MTQKEGQDGCGFLTRRAVVQCLEAFDAGFPRISHLEHVFWPPCLESVERSRIVLFDPFQPVPERGVVSHFETVRYGLGTDFDVLDEIQKLGFRFLRFPVEKPLERALVVSGTGDGVAERAWLDAEDVAIFLFDTFRLTEWNQRHPDVGIRFQG